MYAHKKDFYSVYQPIVDVNSKEVMAFEALTRVGGKAPVDVLRQSYEGGHIVEFDFKCLHSSVKGLPDILPHQKLFLNLEPMTVMHAFKRGREGDDLLKEIKPYAGQVVFELTEGLRLKDFEQILSGVDFIRKHGFQVALDDLTDIGPRTFKLSSLRPHFFKIDISLVQGIAGNKLHREIVKELIRIANMQGSDLIAEGIENIEDFKVLRGFGIRYMQGFLFAKPQEQMIQIIDWEHLG